MKPTCLFIALLLPTFPVSAAGFCEGLTPTKTITADTEHQNYDGTKNNDVIVIKKLKKSVWLYLSGGNDTVCIEGVSKSEGEVLVRSIGEHSVTISGENFKRFIAYKDLDSLNEKGKLSVKLQNIKYADITGFIEKDTIVIDSEEGYIFGGKGNDSIKVTSDKSYIYGEDGNDSITAIAKSDASKFLINGGYDTDYLTGSEAEDLIIGDRGSDQIWGNGGDDLLIGGGAHSSNDDYFGDGFYLDENPITDFFYDNELVFLDDTNGGGIYGGDGDDVVIGSDGNEALEGGAGKDYIEGRGGMDGIHLGNMDLDGTGKTYNWTLADGSKSGSFPIRTIPDNEGGYANGGDDEDEIWGSDSADELIGGRGNDDIYSMEGNDKINMGNCGDVDYGFGMGGSTSWVYCKGDYVIHLRNSGYKVK